MSNRTELQQRYRELTSLELYRILKQPEGYTDEALELAREEYDQRNLFGDELEAIKNSYQLEQRAKNEAAQEVEQRKEKALDLLDRAFENINFIKRGPPRTEKIVRGLGLLALILSVRWLWTEYSLIMYFLRNPWDNSYMLWEFVPKIVLVLGTVGFLLRKPIGWKALFAYFTYPLVLGFPLLMRSYAYDISNEEFEYERLFRPPNFVDLFFVSLFLFGLLFTLNRPAIRELFQISRPMRNKVGLFAIAAAILVMMIQMYW